MAVAGMDEAGMAVFGYGDGRYYIGSAVEDIPAEEGTQRDPEQERKRRYSYSQV